MSQDNVLFYKCIEPSICYSELNYKVCFISFILPDCKGILETICFLSKLKREKKSSFSKLIATVLELEASFTFSHSRGCFFMKFHQHTKLRQSGTQLSLYPLPRLMQWVPSLTCELSPDLVVVSQCTAASSLTYHLQTLWKWASTQRPHSLTCELSPDLVVVSQCTVLVSQHPAATFPHLPTVSSLW